MEALSIQTVKPGYRPADTPAQGGLGDVFQAMLRENAERPDPLDPTPPAEDRPERAAPRRTSSADRTEVAGGDRSYERDTDDREYDVSGPVEPRQEPSDDVRGNREAPRDRDTTPAPNRSAASDQPADDRAGDTPAADGAPGVEEQIPVASETRVSSPGSASSSAAETLVAPGTGNSGLAGQTTNTAVLPGATDTSGKGTGVPTATTAAAGQTQNPAPPQTAAPSAGAGTGAPPGGNGTSAHVTVTSGQVVATPNANLGGGATTAAIAAVSNPDLPPPATPSADPANRVTQSAATAAGPASNSQSASGGAAQPGAPSTAAIVPTDSPDLPAASAGTAAATVPTQKPGGGSANSQGRGAASLNAATADTDGTDAATQKTLGEATPARPTQNNIAQASGGTSQDMSGQNTGAKTTNTQNQPGQATPQPQADQGPKTAAQTSAAATPQAAALQGAQTGFANTLAQGPQVGESGAGGGSTAATDVAASRAANAPTGGFTQIPLQAPDTLGSLTRSGGTQPTTANQVAVEIQKAVNAGKDHIRVRLNPAELGQIDVSLKVRHDGTVKAVVTTDRPETFDLMQRDARGLERALQDAGLKTDAGSLTFNLRGGDQHGPNNGQRGPGLAAQSGAEADRTADSPAPDVDHPAPVVSNRALDMRV